MKQANAVKLLGKTVTVYLEDSRKYTTGELMEIRADEGTAEVKLEKGTAIVPLKYIHEDPIDEIVIEECLDKQSEDYVPGGD